MGLVPTRIRRFEDKEKNFELLCDGWFVILMRQANESADVCVCVCVWQSEMYAATTRNAKQPNLQLTEWVTDWLNDLKIAFQ